MDALAEPIGDLDLLVGRGVGPAADAALAEAGFLRLRVWAGGGQRFHLGYDEATGTWVHLHVVDRLAFGDHAGLELAEAGERCLERRRPAGEAGWSLDPADELWVTLLHALLDKDRVKPAHRDRLAALLASVGEEGALASPVASAWASEGGGQPARVLASVRAGDWAGLEGDRGRVRSAWEAADPEAAERRRRNVRSLQRRKLAEPLAFRGLQVALLAPDGAGKSTVARAVADAFFLEARVLYLGLYGASDKVLDLPVPGAGLVQRLGRTWVRWTAARYHQARRRLVVFDRHPYDARLEPPRPAGPASAVRRAVLGRALPPPDLVIVLDAPGQLLFDRKGEHDPETLEAQRQNYLRLARKLRRVEVVDATADPDAVARAVTGAVWRRYLARQRS